MSDNPYVLGLAFWSDWGSLRSAGNAAFSAALYHDIYNHTEAEKFAQSQADYILGDNSYERSFVVGWGSNPPSRPHHKNAFGRDEWFGASDTPLYSLQGAVVGGPHSNAYSDGWLDSPAGYQDIMTDYITNEVTIDYNVGLIGTLASMLVSSSSSNPSHPTNLTTAPNTTDTLVNGAFAVRGLPSFCVTQIGIMLHTLLM